MENQILSDQELKSNVQTQQTGEGEFVTTDTSGDYSLFAPKAITKVKKTFEKDIIPGSSSVTSREIVTDLSKVSNLPKIQDVMPIDNPEIKSEIDSMVGFKDKSGEIIPFSENLDVDTKIRIMNLGAATDFVYKREDGEFDSIKIPYDIGIAKMIKEPEGYIPPSAQAITSKMTSIESAYTGPDATNYEIFKQQKDQGRFPSYIPFIGGDKIGVTLDNVFGTNFDETGGQIALAKAYNKILIKAGLNERQRYGILKERLANKFKDLYNIMGYGRRGIRFGIEAGGYILGETYDLLSDNLKKATGFDIAKFTGTQNFKDSVSRTNFYDMIMPLQANIIQDGFAAQNIEIDLGTAEMLASMFTSTPMRLAAIGAEIGLPSSVATKITTMFGKKELAKYKAYRTRKLFRMGPTGLPSKDKDFDRKLIEEYSEYRAKSAPFLNRFAVGDFPLLGKIYTKINSLRTGPALVHGLQIEEAGKVLSDNVAVKTKLAVVQNLQKQKDQLIENRKSSLDPVSNKRLEILNKQIDTANKDLRYEISTANVPEFIKDIAKGNKAMIIGSATMGQLAQEGAGDVQVFEMLGLFGGLSFAMASNQRALLNKVQEFAGKLGVKKGTLKFTEELAKRVNTFSPEFAQVLQKRIQYIDQLQQDLKNQGVPEELLNTSFATMSNLAILQTLEETSRIDVSQKDVAKFGQVIEDFQQIHTSKQELLNKLKEVTLQIADFRKRTEDGEVVSQVKKFEKTIEVAYKYAKRRAEMLEEDIKLLQGADLVKIESIIKGTVGKLEDTPVDNGDYSSALTRVYKLGFSPTEFPSQQKIKEHNLKVFTTVDNAVNEKSKSLRTELLLKKGQKLVPSEKDMPEYKNSDDLFLAFGENKRNFENAEVSSFFIRLDKAKFVDENGKLIGGGAKVEGMDILERFLDVVPKDSTEVFTQVGGGAIGSSKQSQVFKAFDQSASETIDKLFESLPPEQLFSEANPEGFKNVGEFVNSILANAPKDMKNFSFMPKNLQAAYIIYKQGQQSGFKIDSLPVNFDQLKELRTSFSRLQAKFYNPNDTTVSNKFLDLKNTTTNKFQEFEVGFGTPDSQRVGNLFILDSEGVRVPVARVLADGNAAHQVYMNRYFDNKTNYNYFFKGRDKTTPTNLNPTGITLAQRPSFTENVDKIFNMNSSELLQHKEDFLKRFGTFKDQTPMGLPQDVQRKGIYFIDQNTKGAKTLTAILELKLAEYISEAADKGLMDKKEYAQKLLKFQKAYTITDSTGKEISLVDARKVEKDLFNYSPASVGDALFKKGEDNLKNALESVSKKNFTTLNETLKDYKQVERNLRSVLPADLKQGQTLIEVASANPAKLKQVKEGILQSFGGKYDAKQLDRLVTEVFMEDLLQKTFRSTGKVSVMGSGKELVTEVDMDVDKLKEIIGFNDKNRNDMIKEVIGEKRMNTLNSMVKWMSEQYDLEKLRANITGVPRNFSVESYISRFYSINRGVISARYVGTEAVLQQFRLKGHKLFKVIIEDEEVGQLFMEIVKTGQPLSRGKEIQFFNALVSSLNKLNTYANSENPEQTVILNDNYKAKFREYDLSNQTLGARQ